MPAKGQTTEIQGEKHGRLTVLFKSGRTNDRKTIVTCRCDCGGTTSVILRNLRNGNTRSCGCLANESRAQISRKHATHLRHNTPEYHTWEGIIQRCTNPSVKNWKDYGGRGITVCERWRAFEAFFEDMGERPPQGTIDRIDNDGPYSPENCRWATMTQQNRNQRRSTFFTVDGVTAHINDWAEKAGITPNLIRARIRYGWSEKAAITTPNTRKK